MTHKNNAKVDTSRFKEPFFVGAEIKMMRYFYLIPDNVVNFKDFMTATTSSVTNVDIYSIVDYYDDRFQKAWEVLAQ